jgi:hypothetical protein
MSDRPYEVDWDYVRSNMRVHRGGDSYRTLADRFTMLSAATCHRFLRKEEQLDLASLLCVMSELDLIPGKVLIRRSQQLELMPRGKAPVSDRRSQNP